MFQACTDGRMITITSIKPNVVCPHIPTLREVPTSFQLDFNNARCSDCSLTDEIWLCMVCLELRCGRFEKRHMVEHFGESGHCLTICLKDLSIWCNGCNTYLNWDFYPKLALFFKRMYQMKFNEEPTAAIQNQQVDENRNLDILEASLLQAAEFSDPPTKCCHLDVVSNSLTLSSLDVKCGGCQIEGTNPEKNNNWYCLSCGNVSCGRDSSKHMMEHFNQTQHAICISFEDLSIWCYRCGIYLDYSTYPPLRGPFEMLHRLKFPSDSLVPIPVPKCVHFGSLDNTKLESFQTKFKSIEWQCEQCAKGAFSQMSDIPGPTLEIWVCLECCSVLCGRYDYKHMAAHAKRTEHYLCLSLNDLSLWCHKCDMYLDFESHPGALQIYKYVHSLKFPELESLS